MRTIVVIAHNIRSMWNIGSLFRTSDAFAIQHLYLSGYTSSPPRKEISKTALGAEETVPWTTVSDPQETIQRLRSEGYAIIGLEKNEKSISLFSYPFTEKVCLILGHEISGVSEQLQQECEAIVHIPMHGKKESLNVSVATGIALATIRCC